ncbi:hypothetical protein [Kitasatospora sp. NPDC094011]|uniref:hypothetical protein n=1 Tax=Kitasatospora sp. NPDC094011 TaxID=3364090 RepID=UPI00382F5128
MDAADETMSFTNRRAWPHGEADLLHEGPDWWSLALLDWPRDRWLGYVSGYAKAAEAIADQIVSTRSDQDTLIYPFVMCWRHYVEIQLKSLIQLASVYLDEPHVLMRSHSIEVLWRRARPLLERSFPGDDNADLDNAERALLQLHGMDPSSEHFRYPVRNSGDPTLDGIARLHVRNFHNVMMGVANMLDGADTGIREMTDNKHEMAEYMHDFHGG